MEKVRFIYLTFIYCIHKFSSAQIIIQQHTTQILHIKRTHKAYVVELIKQKPTQNVFNAV
jgi:hypothetical protein